jgi:hypothetical protein
MHVRDPAIVRPTHQQITDIDGEVRRGCLDADPGTVAGLNL